MKFKICGRDFISFISEDFHIKRTGCWWEILKRTSLRYQGTFRVPRYLFCGRGLKLFFTSSILIGLNWSRDAKVFTDSIRPYCPSEENNRIVVARKFFFLRTSRFVENKQLNAHLPLRLEERIMSNWLPHFLRISTLFPVKWRFTVLSGKKMQVQLRRNRNYTTKEMSEKCGSARNRTWVSRLPVGCLNYSATEPTTLATRRINSDGPLEKQ